MIKVSVARQKPITLNYANIYIFICVIDIYNLNTFWAIIKYYLESIKVRHKPLSVDLVV